MKTFKQSAKHRFRELFSAVACLAAGLLIIYFGIDLTQEDFNSRIIRFLIVKAMLIGGGLALVAIFVAVMIGVRRIVFRKVIIGEDAIMDTSISNKMIFLNEITSGKLLRGDSSCVFVLDIKGISKRASIHFESFNPSDKEFIENFLISKLKEKLTEEKLGL